MRELWQTMARDLGSVAEKDWTELIDLDFHSTNHPDAPQMVDISTGEVITMAEHEKIMGQLLDVSLFVQKLVMKEH